MPTITLPDGKKINFDKKITGFDIASKISKSLSKQALIISVDGELKDLSYEVKKDCSIRIITAKDSEGLDAIRHDTTHIMAMAVQELFSGTKIAIGPAIKDGFYYDFSRKEPFTPGDLEKIEKKMKEIVEKNEPTRREVWERKKAKDHYKNIGEDYKVQLVDSIPNDEEVSVYYHGKWYDLCRGPHLTSTGKIGKFFKLTKVSGA